LTCYGDGMGKLTISLSDDMIAYATEQARAEGVELSDLIALLLDQDREARERLLAAIDEGEASGISELSFDEIIEQARQRARSRAA